MAKLQEYRIESHNLDGQGARQTRVYDMLPVRMSAAQGDRDDRPLHDSWAAVTDVSCPCCEAGTVRWAEAGYVPGYRICDDCGRHFQAKGTDTHPTLLLVGKRRN